MTAKPPERVTLYHEESYEQLTIYPTQHTVGPADYISADVHERVVAERDALRAQLAALTERDWDALGRECLWRVLDAQSVPAWLRSTFGGKP
jgi:hypothetical protein